MAKDKSKKKDKNTKPPKVKKDKKTKDKTKKDKKNKPPKVKKDKKDKPPKADKPPKEKKDKGTDYYCVLSVDEDRTYGSGIYSSVEEAPEVINSVLLRITMSNGKLLKAKQVKVKRPKSDMDPLGF